MNEIIKKLEIIEYNIRVVRCSLEQMELEKLQLFASLQSKASESKVLSEEKK